jgi:DNA-binding response OmpR family regulator
MESKTEKLLVVESDDALRERIVTVLNGAAYQVSTDYDEGTKSILAFGPDAVILGADPPQLDCCDLLSEIKGSERTQNVRVVMLSPGGSGERTRGMDLGADDVLSLPFDPHELLSRVRSQLRTKSLADEFRERLRLAEENRTTAQQVVTAVNEERRTLRVGGLASVAVLIVAGLVLFFLFRRTQEQNTRVYAAITRLQTGVLTQQQLMERSRRTLEDRDLGTSGASYPQQLELQKKGEDLRSQIAISKAENTSALQNQLTAALADSHRSAVSGGPVVLLGYPTALDAILARAGAETLQSIATASKGDPKQVMEELARRKLIRPVTTQGHIGDVLPDKIVYDAQTTSGGSGGPLFNDEGKVIGINFAMVREFGGSNFAVPVGYGMSLLKP